MTVKELIHQLGARQGPDNKNGVTEMVQLGDGAWGKGRTILKSDGGANKTLVDIGWDDRRGGSLPPIWLVVSKGP